MSSNIGSTLPTHYASYSDQAQVFEQTEDTQRPTAHGPRSTSTERANEARIRRIFSHPAHAAATEEHNDPLSAVFDEVLRQATPATLNLQLRNAMPLPERLTLAQCQRLNEILGDYHEHALRESPWIDADGKPIFVERNKASTDGQAIYDQFDCQLMIRNDWQGAEVDTSDAAILARADHIMEDYPAYKKWQSENLLYVEDIQENQVSENGRALIGKRGVFAKEDIPPGTVLPFGGMFLEHAEDIEIDRWLRQHVGGNKFYVGIDSPLVAGMDLTMMLNAAHLPNESDPGLRAYGDSEGNNLSLIWLDLLRCDDGRAMRQIFFVTNRTVKQNEQLCYMYGGSGFPSERSRSPASES
jgi:hypothetical protein